MQLTGRGEGARRARDLLSMARNLLSPLFQAGAKEAAGAAEAAVLEKKVSRPPPLQGYLAHKKIPPPRTLQYEYA